jgi:hypothetical protein
MTHDPLCPVIPADKNFSDWGCQCYLIAKVRADEKSRLIKSVIVYDYSGILIRSDVDSWIALQDLQKS